MKGIGGSLTRYFPTKNFHIIPITDLNPDSIKRSAKRAKLDREKTFGLASRQNAIAKHFGFNKGFAGYQKEYESQLLPFMEEQGLRKRTDLIRPRFRLPIIRLTPKQVSDRLFLSTSPTPTRIFTGYDVDWDSLNQKFFSLNNPWTNLNEQPGVVTVEEICTVIKHVDTLFPSLSTNDLLDAALEDQRHYIDSYWNNLLGDQLLEFDQQQKSENQIPTIYFSVISEEEVQRYLEHCLNALRIFQWWRQSQKLGWVEVLPYNEKLIFLKGKNGEYDFVFPNLKDTTFNHNLYEPYLKNDDICISMDSYHYPRWKYFEYTGWEDFDCHEAEKHHYQQGGTSRNHPGFGEHLRLYLIDKNIYQPPTKAEAEVKGFTLCRLDDKVLCVSELITVDQLHHFMASHPDYEEYSRTLRKNDSWQSNNSWIDGKLPASANWYDAVAYAAWVSKTQHLPVRLLSEQEYLQLAAPRQPMSFEEFCRSDASYLNAPQLCQFFLNDTTPTDKPFAELDQACTLRYIPEALQWRTGQHEVRFLTSTYFGEWLSIPSSAINTKTLGGFHAPGISASRGLFSATSTGRYKKMKVGFRLCFQVK